MYSISIFLFYILLTHPTHPLPMGLLPWGAALVFDATAASPTGDPVGVQWAFRPSRSVCCARRWLVRVSGDGDVYDERAVVE